jgi:hypothetical protein
MMALYLAFGIILLCTDIASETLKSYRKELGGTLIVYAIIRTLLFIRKNRKEKNEYLH